MIRQTTAALIALAAASVFLTACGKNDVTCGTDDDCFRGEICGPDDTCVPDPDGPPDDPEDGGTGEENNTSTDAGGTTNGATNGDPVEGVCIVDPFTATCDVPDDNDSSSEYIRFEPSPPGCDSSDDFTGNETTVEGLQICHNETRDIYSTNLIPCDEKNFVVEVTITPKQDCDPDHYDFNVGVQGNDCDEPNDLVRCEQFEDGRKRVTAIVEPSISIAVTRIVVEKNVDDLKFDYDLDLVVRQ